MNNFLRLITFLYATILPEVLTQCTDPTIEDIQEYYSSCLRYEHPNLRPSEPPYPPGSEAYNRTVEYYRNLIQNSTAASNAYQYPTNANAYLPNDPQQIPILYGEFDFIVVGAGSAGAVIARRLAEVSEWRVLLLEAGQPENDFSIIPSMYLYLQASNYSWGYFSTPQTTACLGMVDQRCPFPRGKVLGGSSGINAMIYARGNRWDFDRWASEGNQGWAYDEILPYFKKSENSKICGDPGYHGENGPWNVEYHRPTAYGGYALVQASVEAGHTLLDYNGKEQLGVGLIQLNTIDGQRDSTGRAFLGPYRNRRNLVILTGAYVERFLINHTTQELQSVVFTHQGTRYFARSSKEYILSAGTINSPHILMHSGIGPAEELRKNNITVVKDLPVGLYLQDHACFYGLLFETNTSLPTNNTLKLIETYLNGTGYYTTAQGIEAVAFYKLNGSSPNQTYPDVELLTWDFLNVGSFVQRGFSFTNATYDSVWGKLDPSRTIAMDLILLHPRSFGNITISSGNPYDYPLINPRFLSDPEGVDIERMYQGVQLMLSLIETDAYQRYNTRVANHSVAGCEHLVFLSKEYWYCFIRQATMNLYHPSSTCRMGNDPRKGAVVNSRLKVHGINRLRIADVSVFPHPTSGHPSSAAAMIGERLADWLKEEYEGNKGCKA